MGCGSFSSTPKPSREFFHKIRTTDWILIDKNMNYSDRMLKLVETEPEDKIFSAKLKLKICELVEKMNEAEPNIVAEGDYCSYPCYEYNRNLINNCPKCGGKVIMDIENPYT